MVMLNAEDFVRIGLIVLCVVSLVLRYKRKRVASESGVVEGKVISKKKQMIVGVFLVFAFWCGFIYLGVNSGIFKPICRAVGLISCS